MSKKANGRRPGHGHLFHRKRRTLVSFDEETWEEIAAGVTTTITARIRELVEWGLEAERENRD